MILAYSSGGKRDGAGRKTFYAKKMVSRPCNLSLPEESWLKIDKYLQRNKLSLAAYIRTLVEDDLYMNHADDKVK